jgi:hypothetical protein
VLFCWVAMPQNFLRATGVAVSNPSDPDQLPFRTSKVPLPLEKGEVESLTAECGDEAFSCFTLPPDCTRPLQSSWCDELPHSLSPRTLLYTFHRLRI